MKIITLMTATALAGGLVTGVGMPAFAGTPGAPCTIWVSGANYSSNFPGHVSQDGTKCMPDSYLAGNLTALNSGVQCGGHVYIPTAVGTADAYAECPY